MNYKVEKGTELFDRFVQLRNKMIEANSAAADYANSVDAVQWAHAQKEARKDNLFIETIAGGISAIIFKDNPDDQRPPKGWVRVFRKHFDNAYYPSKQNKEEIAKIESLPVVTRNEMNEIIGFDGFQFVGKKMISSYGLVFGNDCHLISMDPEANFTPVEGMTEIVMSEYKAIHSKIKNEVKRTKSNMAES